MRIAKLDIQSFRGIPGRCFLDFRDKKGNACSAIIYGGNGSGKSSIVDAIEYNLQGRIERSEKIMVFRRPNAQCMSYVDCKDANTMIEFDNGTTSNRTISFGIDEKTNLVSYQRIPGEFHERFRFSPIVLRRNDIISFNMCEVKEKQLLLSQFFYDFSTKTRVENDPIIVELKEKRSVLKEQRSVLIEEVLNLTKLDEEEVYKSLNNNFLDFIKSRVVPVGEIAFSKGKIIKKTVHPKDYQKVLSLAERVTIISEEIKEYNKTIDAAKPKKRDGSTKFTVLNETYEKSGKYLSAAFKEITNADYVDTISLSIANRSITSFEIEVTLVNGVTIPPEKIFSEANYDLMILLLYVSMIRVSAEKGQEKVLILDDVLQSVDATIRTKFMSYILREFYDWQLFITCHDRAWLNQLRFLFNNLKQGGYHPFKEFSIVGWSFDNGPIIKENKSCGVDERLLKAFETDDIHVIASTAGPFFEMICDNLSMSLHSQIYRNPDDRYTIHDLWVGLKKVLSKIGLEKEVDELDRFSFIRNMISCHNSQWSEGISDYEIRRFAKAVQNLYEKTFCRECLSWISGKYNEDKCCNKRHLVYKKQ